MANTAKSGCCYEGVRHGNFTQIMFSLSIEVICDHEMTSIRDVMSYKCHRVSVTSKAKPDALCSRDVLLILHQSANV